VGHGAGFENVYFVQTNKIQKILCVITNERKAGSYLYTISFIPFPKLYFQLVLKDFDFRFCYRARLLFFLGSVSWIKDNYN